MLSVVTKFRSHTDLESTLALPFPSWLTLTDATHPQICFFFCKEMRRVLPTPEDFSKALYITLTLAERLSVASVFPFCKMG